MSDEPSNTELARRLDDQYRLLQALIGRNEYTADQRANDHRFAEVAADLADVRHQHAEDTRVLHERISTGAQSHVNHQRHWQQLIFTGLIPALVAVVAILAELWVNQGGSH